VSKYIFIIIVSSIVIISTLFAALLIRYSNRIIWQKAKLDFFARSLPLFAIAMITLAIFLGYLKLEGAFPFLLVGALLLVLISVSLIIGLPFSLLSYQAAKSIKPLDRERREFIKGFSAAFPLLLSASTVYGIGDSFRKVQVREVPFYFTDLRPDLQGLKILHLSDLHLRLFFSLSDLEKMIPQLMAHKPHLVLITGDIADDLKLLPDALKLINQIHFPLGGYISVGNHEYYRGIKEVKRIIDRSAFPFLLNKGFTFDVGSSKLFIGGLDDPRTLSTENYRFLQDSLDRTLNFDHHSHFKLIMSHRPMALDVAARYNIDLVLSGHTHGGQVGFNGRSVFEGLVKERYLWGKYRKGQTQLYTSAGVGQWLPFRLGCPAEAVMIILKRPEN